VVETSGAAADRTPPDTQRLLESLYFSETLPEAAAAEALLAVHSWVVDEQRLTADMTAGELQAVRRGFARAHHPDRSSRRTRSGLAAHDDVDQKHLDAHTPERAYWHHGYQARSLLT